jgi:ferredoxin
MTCESHLAVAGDTYRGRAEAAHRDARFVKSGHARKQGRAERRCRRRRQRTARKNRAQRLAFVGFDSDPKTVGIRAPCQHRREGRMPVLEESLDARHRPRSFRCGNRDLVHYNGFSILENGFPALAHAWIDELDQPRFGLALWHMGAMVTLRDMAYVIVQPCVGVKDASCVEVCPVDCIHTDDAATMYFIDPDECIDCGACVDPCPVDAIFPEDEVPEQWREYIKINADYFKTKQ